MLGCVLTIKNKRSDMNMKVESNFWSLCFLWLHSHKLFNSNTFFFLCPSCTWQSWWWGFKTVLGGERKFPSNLDKGWVFVFLYDERISLETLQIVLQISQANVKITLQSLWRLFKPFANPFTFSDNSLGTLWELLQTLNQPDKRSKFLKKLVLLQWESITV